MFYQFARVVVGFLLWALTRCQVHGLHQVPRQGPLIVVSNHINTIDPPLLGTVIPRKLRFMAKIELYRSPLMGIVVRLFEAFPVRRGEGDRQALQKALEILHSGGALGMFPEGTRSRSGLLRKGHSGSALLALWSGAPLLPVGIIGSNRVLKWPNILRRPKLVVNIGPPFYMRAPQESLTGEVLDQLTEEMMGHIAALLPPEQRGVYVSSVEALGRSSEPIPQ